MLVDRDADGLFADGPLVTASAGARRGGRSADDPDEFLDVDMEQLARR